MHGAHEEALGGQLRVRPMRMAELSLSESTKHLAHEEEGPIWWELSCVATLHISLTAHQSFPLCGTKFLIQAKQPNHYKIIVTASAM